MAGPNPLAQLAPLNRIRGSIIIPLKPQLNVTAPFLTRDGISVNFEGDITAMLAQMVGFVQSQEVYIKASVVVGIVKSSTLGALYKTAMESDSNLGDITVVPDTSNLPNYQFSNCSIEGLERLAISGQSADYPIRIAGTYFVNSNLFNVT